jgi:AcrR family transcriptional regulator
MFMERGYLGTSLDDIAGAIGSTKGRIYHYYNSKADLYLAVHHAAMQMIIDEIAPLAALPLPPAERLRHMAAAQLRMVMQAGPFQKAGMVGLQRRTVKMTTARQKRAMAAVLAMRDQFENMFADVIREGIATGEFADRPAKLLTKPLQGAINWALSWFDPDRPTSSKELDEMVGVIADYVVGGLLSRPVSQASNPAVIQEAPPTRVTRGARKTAA